MSACTPTKTSRLINHTPFFYGWVIAAAGAVSIVMIGPSQTYTVGIFLESMIPELGISRSAMALIYGIATIVASVLLPVTGRSVDRYGPRRMIIIAAFGLGLAVAGMTQAQGIISIFVGFFALRFFGFGSMTLISTNIVAQWFIRQRGIVMGYVGLSLPVSLIVYPWLTQLLIKQFEWRGAWAALGLLVWLIAIPIGWLFFRDTPEQYGLSPDGDLQDSQAAAARLANEKNWTLAQARRTGAFWIFTAALSAMTLLMAGLVFHQISLFRARGLDEHTAIQAFAVIAISSVVGNLSMGRLIDKFSARLLLSFTLFLLALALIVVNNMTTPLQGFAYAVLLGLATGFFRVIDAVIWAKYYGRLHLGAIKGATMIGVIGSSAIGAYPLGLSLDYLGSYTPALNGLLFLPLIIGVLVFFIKRPQKEIHLAA